MANMSYCRFENTYHDLIDCFENWEDTDLSDSESEYRQKMLDEMISKLSDLGYNVEEPEDEFPTPEELEQMDKNVEDLLDSEEAEDKESPLGTMWVGVKDRPIFGDDGYPAGTEPLFYFGNGWTTKWDEKGIKTFDDEESVKDTITEVQPWIRGLYGVRISGDDLVELDEKRFNLLRIESGISAATLNTLLRANDYRDSKYHMWLMFGDVKKIGAWLNRLYWAEEYDYNSKEATPTEEEFK